MSKERAVRRQEREREAAIRAAARAAETERRERRTARRRVLKAAMTGRLSTSGAHQGVLAKRRRRQSLVIADILLVLNIVTWFVTDDWSARAMLAIVSVLCFPVLKTLLFPR